MSGANPDGIIQQTDAAARRRMVSLGIDPELATGEQVCDAFNWVFEALIEEFPDLGGSDTKPHAVWTSDGDDNYIITIDIIPR